MGEKTWYIPRWLDRLLPNITIEPPHDGEQRTRSTAGTAGAGERGLSPCTASCGRTSSGARQSDAALRGEGYGSGVSLFLVDNEPGEGRGCTGTLPETWIVRSGRRGSPRTVRTWRPAPATSSVVGPDTPHKFVNLGPGRLDLICVHDYADDHPGGLEEPRRLTLSGTGIPA